MMLIDIEGPEWTGGYRPAKSTGAG